MWNARIKNRSHQPWTLQRRRSVALARSHAGAWSVGNEKGDIRRTYEARAATDLAAIQAVLDQIGKDSAGGP